MGQRFSTSRDSDVSEADGPPSTALAARASDASPTSLSSPPPTASSPPSSADTAPRSTPGTLSTQRPTIENAAEQQSEREGSTRLVDVVHDTLSSDQEPSAHQRRQSDEEDALSASRVSSTDSFPSSPLNVKADDAHPLTRRSSMSRTPAPPKLSRFRPSMDIPRSPQSSSDSSLDSSSSSSDEELVGSGEELVSDWLDEPEDAVLSPPSQPKRTRHASACSSVSSHTGNSVSFSAMHSSGGRNSNSSQHSMTGWASWLSSPDDVEEEDDADDEPVALTPFLRDNMPVYEVMRQVQLFRNLSQMQQEQVVRALKPAKFSDGEVIVAQGTRGSRFYMIAKGEAVVTKTVTTSSHSITGSTPSSAGQTQERMITHLRAGHYFGELALIYDDPRTATVRAVGDVELLYLTQEDFQHIGQVHLSLMLQQVPLLARLSARDQDIVLKCLRPANFSDGEYIVHQGDEGTRFYMITRGEAIVSEKAIGPDKKPYEKELTRLYEGHVFGEMSLIYSEPRTASVRAVGPVKCLYLSKEDFDKCLLSDHFQRFIQEAYVEKATRRAMRLRLQQRANSAATMGSSTPQARSDSSSGSTVAPPPAPSSPVKATETKKLVKQRLKNGQVVVNKYVIKGDLGRGTFGRVKLCESQEDGQMYAVKIMHKTFVQRMAGKEDQLYDVLRREVAIMKKLNHRNVVRLVEVIDDPNSQKMYLVQEYVQHSLMEEVTQARRLSEPVARKYMRDLLSGLQYLHFHKVIHRDIKPENILVSSDGVAKIADFGTARMIMNETETISGAKGTPAFMAPEMFDIDATYQGPAVDVWSLGATLYMMVIGHPPWMADNEIVLAERVQRVELRFPKEVERTMEPHLKNLLQRMLTKDPACRISLKECFTHEWTTKEGSDPLGLITPEKNLTVSMDESERAIENIPEQIDQRLTESLAQAHQLVKTRQESVGPGVVRTNSGRYFTGTPMAGTLGARIPSTASTTSSINTVGSSPSRASSDEVSRIICAWRHHKRVQLMDGHKELSERSRELLIEQKRMAFSVDRAKVTEIILPAAKPTARSRYPSTSSTGRSNSVDNSQLIKKNSFQIRRFKDSGNLEGFGRTSFTSVSQLSELAATPVEESFDQRGSLSSSKASDADLMKRSLSRKKDFLMVTSEVFRDEGGDYQTRKILFQARDDDFSVASRVPTHSNSGRSTNSSSSSQKPRRLGSTGKLGSAEDGNVEEFDMDGIDCVQVTEIDDEDDDDLVNHGMRKGSGASSRHFHHHSDSSRANSSHNRSHNSGLSDADSDSDDSDYSDVECDVDVDATFSELIATPNQLEIISHDDEEIAPIVTQKPSLTSLHDLSSSSLDVDNSGKVLTLGSLASMTSSSSALAMATPSLMLDIVQVYVSSKIRENLTLSIRSGYAEAKGARSYMEDRTTGQTTCDLSRYPAALANNYASLAFFAVYDGHNGTETAVKLQNELHHRFFAEGAGFVESPVTCISSVCEAIDNEILERQNQSVLPKRKRTMAAEEMQRYLRSEGTHQSLIEGECCEIDGEIVCGEEMKQLLQPISFSGAASVFVVVAKQRKKRCRTNDKEGDTDAKDSEEVKTADEDELDEEDQPTRLYVANVGDCRAVLCTADAIAVDLTTDHKASLPAEQERIEASGGFVHNGRLDGILQISRGFGDLAHKQDGHLVVTPDVVEHLVNPADQFLLLASDGLFDVLTSQQAVNFVLRKLQTHGDVQLAAQELVLKAQAYFAHDNISVVIVALNQKGDA
ncbi:serine/threonine-protein kinase [Phytophthora nicotianae]|uniref:cGMP-dependent protein kinase n=1 Tax=Phytophthora nicotianae TaxID=4792 RepID=A0A0W8BQ60_PHYNI|nr:serine/threonine-protein kinase [Phytophthora nicotianae]